MTPALPHHHARITHKSYSMSTCAASRFHPEHPGPWGNRHGQQRAYRWGKGCAGLHLPTTSPSHSFYCSPLYNGAGAGHQDRCHPRTPLLCISSQKPPLPNKNRAGKPGSKLSRPSALLPTPNQASRTLSFLEFSSQLPTCLLSLPTAHACNAWKEGYKVAAPGN